MGYIRHHAIVVTSWDRTAITAAHAEASKLCPGLVTGIVNGEFNGYRSFMVAPDGSKESWSASDEGDRARGLLVEWLDSMRYSDGSGPIAWAEVQYGDDEHDTRICRHSDEPERRKAGIL